MKTNKKNLPIGTTCGVLPRPRPRDDTGIRLAAPRPPLEFLGARALPLDDSDLCFTISICLGLLPGDLLGDFNVI